MKFFGFLLLVLIFAVLPAFTLNSLVMPQLITLQDTYSNMDQIAQNVAE